tara:strand:+ start:1260 stop:1487 length:228 start_codon:yes stop_codon:yes gene_type:complete
MAFLDEHYIEGEYYNEEHIYKAIVFFRKLIEKNHWSIKDALRETSIRFSLTHTEQMMFKEKAKASMVKRYGWQCI